MHFVDAHHHLWDLQHCNYPWLMKPGVQRFFGDPTPIQKNYLPADLLRESADWQPAKSVHVQVGAIEEHSLRESQWLQSLADQPNSSALPNAIVAFADLSASDLELQLEQQLKLPNLRGIRQILGRHVDEDRATGSEALIRNDAFRAGLGLLAENSLSFDLQLIPAQYDAVYELCTALPQLRIAICHCGSPWDQSPAGLAHWREGMRRFAELPNCYCKVSGLGMFRPDWELQDIRPLVEGVIELFGVERVMFGSNFPVDKLYMSYDRIWSAYDELTSGLDSKHRQLLFAGNAERFYRI
jgi:predicted TIM-barrel fold metal-dependent hydrolase